MGCPAHELVAGDERSPVLLHVPHAGTRIPGWVRQHLLLDDAELAAELAALTDHRTDAIALAAADLAAVRALDGDQPDVPLRRRRGAAPGRARADGRGGDGRGVHPRHLRAAAARRRPGAPGRPARRVLHPVGGGRAGRGRAAAGPHRAGGADRRALLPEPAAALRATVGSPRPATCLGTDPVHTPAALVDVAAAGVRGARFGRAGHPVPRNVRAARAPRPGTAGQLDHDRDPPGRPSAAGPPAGTGAAVALARRSPAT